VVGGGGKGTCVLYAKHVSSPSVRYEHREAIYLFQVTPCSPCGTILFRTKLICSTHMCRLVSVRSFYIRWRIHCIRNHAQMLSGFPYGRTQHVRRMRSSMVSVIHYLSTWYFKCHVM